MKSGTSFEQGEVILVPFPFTNLKTFKQRPVLVLSNAEANRFSADFICCGITSNIQNSDHSVIIDDMDMESGHLPKPSRIKVNVIFTLEKSLAIKSLGKIRAVILEKAKEEFLKMF